MSRSESFNNVASGIQSIAVCIGLAVGAVWAVYQFRVTHVEAKARREYAELQQSLGELEMIPHDLALRNKAECLVEVKAAVKNIGRDEATLDIEPLRIAKVAVDSTNDPEFTTVPPSDAYLFTSKGDDVGYLKRSRLAPQEKANLSFIASLRRNQPYFLEFRVRIPPNAHASISSGRSAFFWTTRAYYVPCASKIS